MMLLKSRLLSSAGTLAILAFNHNYRFAICEGKSDNSNDDPINRNDIFKKFTSKGKEAMNDINPGLEKDIETNIEETSLLIHKFFSGNLPSQLGTYNLPCIIINQYII